MRGLFFVIAAFASSATLAVWAYQDVTKPVVAVMPFTNGTGKTVMVKKSFTLPDGETKRIDVDQLRFLAAKRTRQMLAAAGGVTLVDQTKYDAAIAQIELRRSGLFDEDKEFDFGTLLLEEMQVRGSITDINIDDRTTLIAGRQVLVRRVTVQLSVDVFAPGTLITETSPMFEGKVKDMQTSTSSGIESKEELMVKALSSALDKLKESKWLSKTLTKKGDS